MIVYGEQTVVLAILKISIFDKESGIGWLTQKISENYVHRYEGKDLVWNIICFLFKFKTFNKHDLVHSKVNCYI